MGGGAVRIAFAFFAKATNRAPAAQGVTHCRRARLAQAHLAVARRPWEDKDRPDFGLALYIADWVGQLVFSASHRAQRRHLEARTDWEANTMNVVLFCGGYGTRTRNAVRDDIHKPMQVVGPAVCIGVVQ